MIRPPYRDRLLIVLAPRLQHIAPTAAVYVKVEYRAPKLMFRNEMPPRYYYDDLHLDRPTRPESCVAFGRYGAFTMAMAGNLRQSIKFGEFSSPIKMRYRANMYLFTYENVIYRDRCNVSCAGYLPFDGDKWSFSALRF